VSCVHLQAKGNIHHLPSQLCDNQILWFILSWFPHLSISSLNNPGFGELVSLCSFEGEWHLWAIGRIILFPLSLKCWPFVDYSRWCRSPISTDIDKNSNISTITIPLLVLWGMFSISHDTFVFTAKWLAPHLINCINVILLHSVSQQWKPYIVCDWIDSSCMLCLQWMWPRHFNLLGVLLYKVCHPALAHTCLQELISKTSLTDFINKFLQPLVTQ
jgi:hypothetical protein